MIPIYFLSLLLFSPLTSSAALNNNAPIHFPLIRRSSRRTPLNLGKAADHLRMKYGFPPVTPPTFQKRQSTAGVPVVNQDQDSSYYASVNIGTPAQSFDVILDTGSADLWVTSTSCTTCTPNTPLFNPSSSSTFKTSTSSAPVQIQYGSGTVEGQLSSDNVNMGGLTVDSQIFLAVDETSSGLLDTPVSGIMGLGFQTIASTNAVPWWQALLNSNEFTSPEFAFWITRFGDVPNASTAEPGGVLTLGGTNSSLFQGNIDFVNMPAGQTPSFWLLEISNLNVAGKPVQITTGAAALTAIDTGTTLIGGPTTDVTSFWATVPNSQALQGENAGYYAYPCDTSLDVSISFGSQSWPINNDDMNIGTAGPNQCVGAIFDLALGSQAGGGGGGNPNWVVGDTFLKNVYSVYRATPPSVGFAQLSSTAGGSGAPGGNSSSSDGSGGSKSSIGSASRARIAPAAMVFVLVAGYFLLL